LNYQQKGKDHLHREPGLVANSFLVGDIVVNRESGSKYIVKSLDTKSALLLKLSDPDEQVKISAVTREVKVINLDLIEHANDVSVKNLKGIRNKLYQDIYQNIGNKKYYRSQVIAWNVQHATRKLLSSNKNKTTVQLDLTQEDEQMFPNFIRHNTIDFIINEKGSILCENFFWQRLGAALS
jgi:hypothetical protein